MYSFSKFYQCAIVFTFLLLCSCDPSPSILPIQEESLVKILSDVHIIEGALQNQKNSLKDSIAKAHYDQVYKKHDISEKDFVSTLEMLEKDPKLLEKIYEKVLIELDSIEKRSYKEKFKKK